jgi:hypothetical protein
MIHKVMDTPEARAFWESIERDARYVRMLPYCLRGGSAAEEQDRELREMEEELARLEEKARAKGWKPAVER